MFTASGILCSLIRLKKVLTISSPVGGGTSFVISWDGVMVGTEETEGETVGDVTNDFCDMFLLWETVYMKMNTTDEKRRMGSNNFNMTF